MKCVLLVGIFAAVERATAQWGHVRRPGDPPYLPFQPWPSFPPTKPALPPSTTQNPVIPKLKGTPKILGLADDPTLNRDSCGSADFFDRTFWTCRDTQIIRANGSIQEFPVITSTGSWSDFSPLGGPDLHPLPRGANPFGTITLEQYGKNSITQAFFPVNPKVFCSAPSGACPDGTRYALWPDLPPMVTFSGPLRVTGYTWIRQSHITSDLGTVTANPATLLYRVDYHPISSLLPDVRSALPHVTVVQEDFWRENEIPFGNYGNVVRDGTAYLYGQANGTTALARVPVASVEDRTAYEYFVDGVWTRAMPAIGQDGINIANANAGGQGTYYYSSAWRSFVWIGGPNAVGAAMYITTAPDPAGPWIQPRLFFTGVSGDYFLGAYSIQAHPSLSKNSLRNEIYITYTKNDLDDEGINRYSSPVVYVEWE